MSRPWLRWEKCYLKPEDRLSSCFPLPCIRGAFLSLDLDLFNGRSTLCSEARVNHFSKGLLRETSFEEEESCHLYHIYTIYLYSFSVQHYSFYRGDVCVRNSYLHGTAVHHILRPPTHHITMGLWRRKRSGSSGASSNTSSETTSTEASHGIMGLSELSLSKPSSKTSSPATSPTSRFMRTLFRSSLSSASSRNKNNNTTGGNGMTTAATPRGALTRRHWPTPSELQQERRINRPLNEQNMEHQRILAAFVFNFGRTRSRRSNSLGAWSARSGISPGATRHASIDSGYSPHVMSHHHHHHMFHHHGPDVVDVMNTTQEIPGEESDKDAGDIPEGVLSGLVGQY
jgi:hypothetical protein